MLADVNTKFHPATSWQDILTKTSRNNIRPHYTKIWLDYRHTQAVCVNVRHAKCQRRVGVGDFELEITISFMDLKGAFMSGRRDKPSMLVLVRRILYPLKVEME